MVFVFFFLMSVHPKELKHKEFLLCLYCNKNDRERGGPHRERPLGGT